MKWLNPELDVMSLAYVSKNLFIVIIIILIINLPNTPDFNELHIIKTALMLFSH